MLWTQDLTNKFKQAHSWDGICSTSHRCYIEIKKSSSVPLAVRSLLGKTWKRWRLVGNSMVLLLSFLVIPRATLFHFWVFYSGAHNAVPALKASNSCQAQPDCPRCLQTLHAMNSKSNKRSAQPLSEVVSCSPEQEKSLSFLLDQASGPSSSMFCHTVARNSRVSGVSSWVAKERRIENQTA